jgi:excisionase family DNA binding protein
MNTHISETLTIKEASELTRLTVATLYAYVRARRVPYLKVGSRVLFRRDDLEAWLWSHRVTPLTQRELREARQASAGAPP